MRNSADKIRGTGNPNVMVCERGTMFGYSDLIVDPRNLMWMRDANCPVVRVPAAQCAVESVPSIPFSLLGDSLLIRFCSPTCSSPTSRTLCSSPPAVPLKAAASPAVYH